MRRWDRTEPRKARIEIIPMIDVMMFLLVFFVLLSLNVIGARGIKTSLPPAHAAQPLSSRDTAVIALGAAGELQLDGQTVAPDTLLGALHQRRQARPALQLIVRADQSVAFRQVIALMDKLKGSGFDQIAFATRKP